MSKLQKEALELVGGEVDFALEKWGEFQSYHEGYAVLLEEVDELWSEIKAKNHNDSTIIFESKQVAAMAVKMMMLAMKNNGWKP